MSLTDYESYCFEDSTFFIQWHPSKRIPALPVTQISGFIFDKYKQLLLVKNKSGWALPGGKPEFDELPLETLYREVREEASVDIQHPKLLGFIEVIEKDSERIFAQLRYVALLSNRQLFVNRYETSERIFVKLDKLKNYISYYRGKTFQAQLESALLLLKTFPTSQGSELVTY